MLDCLAALLVLALQDHMEDLDKAVARLPQVIVPLHPFPLIEELPEMDVLGEMVLAVLVAMLV
jgi:hypothetical protein